MLLLQGGCSEVFGMSERDIFKIKETGVLINLEGTDVLEAGKSYVLTKTGGEPGPAGPVSKTTPKDMYVAVKSVSRYVTAHSLDIDDVITLIENYLSGKSAFTDACDLPSFARVAAREGLDAHLDLWYKVTAAVSDAETDSTDGSVFMAEPVPEPTAMPDDVPILDIGWTPENLLSAAFLDSVDLVQEADAAQRTGADAAAGAEDSGAVDVTTSKNAMYSPRRAVPAVLEDVPPPQPTVGNVKNMPLPVITSFVLEKWREAEKSFVVHGIVSICVMVITQSSAHFTTIYRLTVGKSLPKSFDAREKQRVLAAANEIAEVAVENREGFLKRKFVTASILRLYALKNLIDFTVGDEGGSTPAHVSFFLDVALVQEADAVLKDSQSTPKQMSSSLGKDIWRFVEGEDEFFRTKTDIPVNVQHLCDLLDNIAVTMVCQAFNLGLTLDEADVQDMTVALEELLTITTFFNELVQGGKIVDARRVPHLVLKVGQVVMNGHADFMQAICFTTTNGKKFDAITKVAECKAPKKESRGDVELPSEGNYTPFQLVAADPAPLNKSHLSQCVAEVLATVARSTCRRRCELLHVEKSPVRMYGEVTNGLCAVFLRWAGPDPLHEINPQGEHLQIAHVSQSVRGQLFREKYVLLSAAATQRATLMKADPITRTAVRTVPPPNPPSGDGTPPHPRRPHSPNDQDGEGKPKWRLWNSFKKRKAPAKNSARTKSKSSSSTKSKVRKNAMSDTTNAPDRELVLPVPTPPPVPVNPVLYEWKMGTLPQS
eukprot:m.222399 g.222399  ORF g.222399 m.222399 type:complete len:771 (-) comp15623_c0_seq5:2465-4777(-)